MTTWYEITYSGGIRAVEVLKETDKTLTITSEFWPKPSRVHKANRYFPTWEEAHAQLLDDQTKRVESLRLRLEAENGRLGQIRGMKP